ncbi:MAG: polyprenyl synthetase family protein [Eubacteriales bacterium]|nr:polyprenyl synthetase family protein [Eubacteriales bacterium]
MNFQKTLSDKINEIETIIESFLPEESGFTATVAKAMNYSIRAGGKRLRPMLMQETYRLFGGDEEVIRPFMAAMEMIHTHSLIHDDLPAIDNDDYRRGHLTTHKVFGEAMGILSGDALLNYAYEVMLRAANLTVHTDRVLLAMKVMAEKTGMYGMLGGQTVDVENDGKPLDRALLDYIYENKTSALIEAAMMTGAILAGAEDSEVALIEKAAKNIGIAFQIQDDVLDVISTDEELGKPVHSDEKNHKVTYVTLLGLEAASKEVKRRSDDALLVFESLKGENPFLEELIRSLINRRK